MHISKIVIENFRSIKQATIVPEQFNVFVGQNNHGKTNIFEAIEWFYNGSGDISEIIHLHDHELDMSVEIEFSGIQDGIERVTNEKTKEAFRKFANGQDVIRVIRRKSEPKKRLLWDESKSEWTAKNFAGFDSAFNDCIPRMQYIATATHLVDVSKWGKKTPIGLMLSGVLTALLERSESYRQFRTSFDAVFQSEDSDIRKSLKAISDKVKSHIEQQFPDCTSVTFNVVEPMFEDLLKNFEINLNDGIDTKADAKGDGMQRALMVAIIKAYSDYRRESEELGKNFLFLIDEAELHLHPTAQRQLKAALLQLARNGDQVLINTHSSVLIADNPSDQSVFEVHKTDCVTAIVPASESSKPQIIFELLGGSPADLYFPCNFLITEGRTEFIILNSVINRFYSDKPRLQIIFARGDIEQQRKSMEAIIVAFTPLYQTPIYQDRLVILCDKPNAQQQKDFDAFKVSFPKLEPNDQLLTLPHGSIEECYPTPWKKTTDEVKALTGRQKTDLASEVAAGITQEQFESEMPEVYAALLSAWNKAYTSTSSTTDAATAQAA